MCTSKFALIMMLKVVICIGNDCVENVFSLGSLVCRWGTVNVDVCPGGGVGTVVARSGIGRERNVKRSCHGVRAEMEQWFDSHGSVRVEITCLCQNKRKSSSKIPSNDVVCPFFATFFIAEGMVTIDVMVMMATDARGPVWVDREVQLALDAEEEH